MPTVRHPRRWWNCCMSDDEKTEIEPILLSNGFNAHQQYRSIETFYHLKLYTRLGAVQKF